MVDFDHLGHELFFIISTIFMIICSKHTVPGQVGFVMKKKFCHETFLTSSRGILIARNFSKEKKYSYVREWSNFCIGESSSDFFNIPT